MRRWMWVLWLGGCDLLVAPGGGLGVVDGPCGGSRTAALWFDDADVGYAGCGENGEGTGLFRTADGGLTWGEVTGFGTVRVSDIRRGPGAYADRLFLAGKDTAGAALAWSWDGAGAPVALLSYDGASMRIGHAENIVVTAGGRAAADSLTGNYLAGTDDLAAPLTEYEYLDERTLDGPPPGVNVHPRRLVAVGEAVWGVGSVINDPAGIYLPSEREDATPWMMTTVQPDPSSDGELLDLHVTDARDAIAVGRDQTSGDVLAWRLAGDPYDPASWSALPLGLSGGGIAWDVVVDGDVVLVVGERAPSSAGGFALLSTDGGASFTDIAPAGAPALSKAWRFADGRVLLLGSGGYGALGTP